MIAALRGMVLSKTPQQLVLDVAGVGYLVNVTTQTAQSAINESELFLHTALIVREDALTLFGFVDAVELKVFETLRSVSGVGPKSALAILSTLDVAQVRDAVATENDSVFRTVSGIGPKTAKLIVVALGGKLGDVAAVSKPKTGESANLSNVIAALIGLGYTEAQATQAVRNAVAQVSGDVSSDKVLKLALSALAASKSQGRDK